MHESWSHVLDDELAKPYLVELLKFVATEREHHKVYPPKGKVFTAFEVTPFDKVRVVILGQDPYPSPGHAHGLSFSVPPGVRPPKSLVNIYKELKADLGIDPVGHGYLMGLGRARGVPPQHGPDGPRWGARIASRSRVGEVHGQGNQVSVGARESNRVPPLGKRCSKQSPDD